MPNIYQRIANSPAQAGIGAAHEKLSRANMRSTMNEALKVANDPKTPAPDVYKSLLTAEKMACKLSVRDPMAAITKPLDAVFGTRRLREDTRFEVEDYENAFDTIDRWSALKGYQLNTQPGDVGALGAVLGFTKTFAFVGSGLAFIPPAALAGALTLPFGPTPFIHCYGAGLAAAVASVQVPYLLAEHGMAVPSAALKGLGTGLGALKASVVAKRRASQQMRARGFVPQVLNEDAPFEKGAL